MPRPELSKWQHHRISACSLHRSCLLWCISFPALAGAAPYKLSKVVTFSASAHCCHEHHFKRSLSKMAGPPLQPPTRLHPPAALHKWRLSKSKLQLRRTSHPNPWAGCREKGVKNHTSPRAETPPILKAPQSPTP